MIDPSFVFVYVQVTLSPATERDGRESACRCRRCHRSSTVEAGELPVRDSALGHGVRAGQQTALNVFVFDNVGSASSSSQNGDRPVPVVVNAKSTPASGTASFVIVIDRQPWCSCTCTSRRRPPSGRSSRCGCPMSPARRSCTSSPVSPSSATDVLGHRVAPGNRPAERRGVRQGAVGVVIQLERRQASAGRREREVDARVGNRVLDDRDRSRAWCWCRCR